MVVRKRISNKMSLQKKMRGLVNRIRVSVYFGQFFVVCSLPSFFLLRSVHL